MAYNIVRDTALEVLTSVDEQIRENIDPNKKDLSEKNLDTSVGTIKNRMDDF